VVGRYLYDPFGQLLGKWGGLADANRYRFSSKEFHGPSGIYYYGFRFYEPNLQRWLNQDPLAESGGVNLYAFVHNSSLKRVDAWGLSGVPEAEPEPEPEPPQGEITREVLEGARCNYRRPRETAVGTLEWFREQSNRRAVERQMVMEGKDPNMKYFEPPRGERQLPLLPPEQLDLPFTYPRPGGRGPTSGILCYKGNQIRLGSGKTGTAIIMPKGAPGQDNFVRFHAEGRAAEFMWRNGVRDATFYINNPVICERCSRNLPSALPPGAQLTVVLPNGTPVRFVGGAQ
jgi:RHS repeat-associated protein